MSEPSRSPAVLIAVNRKAGDGRRAARVAALVDALAGRGCGATVVDDLREAAERAAAEHAAGRLHAVVAAGGDGTLNALLNMTPAGTPLAVFPCGTENLLARHLRLPHDPQEAAEVTARGRRRRYDVGRVDGRLFLLTLSVGFDAAVIHRLHESRGGNIGHAAYLRPIARAWREYRFPQLRVTTEDAEFRVRWCFVQNLPAYAMRLNFTPAACGDDGLLDYCLFEQGGAWSAVRHWWNVARAAHTALPDTHTGRTARLRIEAVDPRDERLVPVQVDGEPCGTLPITLEALRSHALLIVP